MWTPRVVLDLLLDQFAEIDAFIERIGFRSRVANPAFGIQVFGNLVRVRQISGFSNVSVFTFMTL